MPLYEYECFLCRHRFERIQKATDAQLAKCPACGGEVRRLLGVPALQFKGSGWYVTDYGKGDGSRSTRPDGNSGAPKPAAKKDEEVKKESPKKADD
jgi:putative FmdB family regulatory protein